MKGSHINDAIITKLLDIKFLQTKVGIIEIRNQNTAMVLVLRLKPYCVKKQHILENLFRKFAD